MKLIISRRQLGLLLLNLQWSISKLILFIASTMLIIYSTPITNATNHLSKEEYDRSQIADQPRLPWNYEPRATRGGSQGQMLPYFPQIEGKWWSKSKAQIEEMRTVSESLRKFLS